MQNYRSKSCDIVKTSSPQPKGIFFNYNIKKRTNENVAAENSQDDENIDHQDIQESNPTATDSVNVENIEKNKLLAIDDVSLVPNKMYKIVLVDGKIMLAEHNGDDIAEEHVDTDDSDVEIIESDYDKDCNQNNNSCNQNRKDGKNNSPTVSTPNEKAHKIPDSRPPPKILNMELDKPKPTTIYSRSMVSNEKIMEQLATLNGPNLANNKLYTTKNDLADAREGKAMVLIPLQKYTAVKKKLQEVQANEEIRKAELAKVKKKVLLTTACQTNRYLEDAVKAELLAKSVKKRTTASQTNKYMEEELENLRNFKSRLCQIFTEAQIDMLISRKVKDIQWTDSEMEKVAFLKQIISHTAYVFLKYKLRFPLPPLSIVKQWMIDKNIYVQPVKKKKIIAKRAKSTGNMTKQDTSQAQDVSISSVKPQDGQVYSTQNQDVSISSEQPQDGHMYSTQNQDVSISSEQPQDGHMYSTQNQDVSISSEQPQDGHMYSTQNQDVSISSDQPQDEHMYSMQNQYMEYGEMVQAIHSITDNQHTQDLKTEISPETQHMLSVPVDTGEELIVYTDDNNLIINDTTGINDSGYMNDDNVASTEEVVHTVVRAKRRKPMVDAIPRCRLCSLPFNTEEEVREHVPSHYHNSMYTTYLDATKPYTCEFCNEMVKGRWLLVRHHRAHLGINELKCWYPGCDYIATKYDNLKSHHDSHRPPSFSCDVCGAMFKTHKYMRGHRERRHAPRVRLQCHLCPAACLTELAFQRHVMSHARPPTLKCSAQGCPERFYSRVQLRAHFQAQHGRSVRCPLCPAAYSSQPQLNRHLERHETKKFSHCVKCLKVFYEYGEYYMHCKQEQHCNVKYNCACGERFTSKKKLIRHKLECFIPDEDYDALKLNKPQKRKRNSAIKTEDTGDNPSCEQPKRKKKAHNIQTVDFVENNVVVPDKTYERNIIIEKQEIVEVSEDNQITISTLPNASEKRVVVVPTDLTQNFIATKNIDSPKVLKLKKVASVPKELQNKVIALPSKLLEKVSVPPANHDQQQPVTVVPQPACYEEVIAASANNLDTVIALSKNNEQKTIALSTNDQRKVIAEPANHQQDVINDPRDVIEQPANNQQNVVLQPIYPKVKVITQPTSYQQNVIAQPAIDQQKVTVQPANQQTVVTVPEYPLQKFLVLPINHRQNVLSDRHNQNVRSVSENSVQKQTLGEHQPNDNPSETQEDKLHQSTVISSNDNTSPTPEKKPLKKFVYVPKDQYLKQLASFPNRYAQQTINPVATGNKIDSSFKDQKKVITVPKVSLKKGTTVPALLKNNPKYKLASNENPPIIVSKGKKMVITLSKPVISTNVTTAVEGLRLNRAIVVPGNSRLKNVTPPENEDRKRPNVISESNTANSQALLGREDNNSRQVTGVPLPDMPPLD